MSYNNLPKWKVKKELIRCFCQKCKHLSLYMVKVKLLPMTCIVCCIFNHAQKNKVSSSCVFPSFRDHGPLGCPNYYGSNLIVFPMK